MNPGFWEDKRVLVTGHTGFKGSWVSLWLSSKGTQVVGYALPPPTNPSLFEIGRLAERLTSVVGDVRDLKHLDRVIATHKPEIVIHMAAQALVRRSYHDPVETYSSNIMGTVNVLDAVRRSDSVRVVVCVTSDKCYENREWCWGYRENERMGGHDPYSSSKGCAELVVAAFRDSYFPLSDYDRHKVAIASVRAGNVIGGGDWARDRLIPDIMNALVTGRRVVIRNPEATRPWQHVLEPLSGYLRLAERLWTHGPQFAQAWNFGPYDENAKPVSWIVERIASMWGQNAAWQLDSADHPHENTFLKLDSSKARALLGWAPRLDLSTALEWIVEWYHAYKDNQNIMEVTEAQVNRYERWPAP